MSEVAEVSPKYLAEIASNAVPAGYKQTEVGMIPEDWDVATIEELAGIIDPQPDHRTPPESSNGEPYIGISDFINSKEVDWTSSRKIISKAVDKQEKSFQVQKGDIVFGKIGTIGVPKFIPQVPFRFALSANVILLQPKNVEPVYLMEFFYSELFQKTLNSELHSTSQAAFGMNKMRLIKLPLPPKKEQAAIANALSDVDALISELEKLIAKKQAIKTATMQQLLTGRTRLPPFAFREDGTPTNSSGTNLDAGTGGPKGEGQDGLRKGTKPSELGEIPDDWEVVELGSVIERFVGGGTPSRSNAEYWGSEIPWVTVKDFATFNPYAAQESITKKGLISSASNLIPKGTLITSTRMALGKAVIYQVDVAINQDMKALFCGQKLSTEFLYFWFEANKNKIDELGSGSTVKGLSLPDLRKVSFLLPPKEEQTAIATILSDMDEERQALEQLLSKTRQIKQGMMQELLTGRTRLV